MLLTGAVAKYVDRMNRMLLRQRGQRRITLTEAVIRPGLIKMRPTGGDRRYISKSYRTLIPLSTPARRSPKPQRLAKGPNRRTFFRMSAGQAVLMVGVSLVIIAVVIAVTIRLDRDRRRDPTSNLQPRVEGKPII